jgi:hypothetical protein
MRSRLAAIGAAATSTREPGQIVVLFALFLVVLIVLAGSAYDYGSIVVDNAKLQNAVDAGVLAGSDALTNAYTLASPATIAQSTAIEYLRLNGVATTTPGTDINITFPTSTPVPGMPTPAIPIPAVLENITLQVTRDHPTAFWPLVGISNVSMNGGGSAHAAHGLIDVMLVMDTTGSMVSSGSIPELQHAVAGFVSAMNPNLGDPRSARIGLAHFQGLKGCQWAQDSNGNNIYPAISGSCQDDYTLLTGLTGDGPGLVQLALGPGGAGCLHPEGCPLRNTNGGGTKLPNAISVINQGNPSYVFGTFGSATGRNDNTIGGQGYAKKILIIMTDGEDNDVSGNGQNTTWDNLLATNAALVHSGPDHILGTQDDVEIYTINYQWCNTADGTVTGHPYPSSECMSQLASFGAGLHECPSGVSFTTAQGHMSPSDSVLFNASSSTAGTCDHYFPLSKGESLPNLLTQLAGTISRGALTQ